MSFTASEIKSMVAGYFRYKKQCPIVAFEASDKLKWGTGEPADILIVSESRMLYEIEVKISLSDLKNDNKKNKHHWFNRDNGYMPIYNFYFAVPNDISDKALEICNELYPYAGLLSVKKFPFNSAALDFGVSVLKSSKRFNSKPLSMRELVYLVREQSGTVCRLSRDKAVIEKDLLTTRKSNHELQKSLKLAGVTV